MGGVSLFTQKLRAVYGSVSQRHFRDVGLALPRGSPYQRKTELLEPSLSFGLGLDYRGESM